MEKELKAPKLRFPGFTDDWEQRKVFDIANRYDNLRVPVAANLRVKGTTPYYGANGIQDYVLGFTHEGEFILVAEDGANDLQNYPVNYVNGRIWVNNHAHVLQGKESIAHNRFLSYSISKANIESVLVGGGRAKLNAEVMMNLDLMLPSYDEQEKIGKYFSNLDNLITLHQRKFETLKKLKKGFLQKMFPKNGESVPEIRFPGFTDAWEQRKVSEITTSYSGGTPKSGTAEYYDGNIPFIRSGEIYSNKTELFITELGLNNSSAKMVHVGDILYALYGATSGEVSRAKLDGAINQAILAVLPNEEINADFLVEWFRKEKENIIATYLQGGQGNLSAQIIKDLMVDIPSSGEQKKIGDYFTNLNNLITLHQRKLDILKKLKQGMLQQMFI